MQIVDDPLEFPKYWLFDIWLNALTLDDIRFVLLRTIKKNGKILLANQNLHSLYICTQNPRVHEFFVNADFAHLDGTSLVYLGRLMGLPFRFAHRSGYMDLFPALLPTMIEHDWRIFYLGAKPEILDLGLDRLRASYPGLTIAGHHGYFSKEAGSAENESIIGMINDFKPNLLFVGMGMPTQELWIGQNYSRLNANAVLHCGGLMDYLAGAIPTPPRWLGPLGLEWTFRLIHEPARLWKRYLVEPFLLLAALLFRKVRGSKEQRVPTPRR